MKKEKRPSNLQRLMGYAGSYRYLTYISWVLSAVSAILALFPFIFIWRLIREVLQVMPDYSKAQHISFNGWMAVIFALISMLIYIAALFCSHKAAFRVQANLRKEMMHHIMELPIGFTGEYGSGRLRKIVNETSTSTETYLAAGAAQLTSGCGRFSGDEFHDGKRNAAQNERISGFSGRYVQRGCGICQRNSGGKNLRTVGIFFPPFSDSH